MPVLCLCYTVQYHCIYQAIQLKEPNGIQFNRTHLWCPDFVADDCDHIGVAHVTQVDRNLASLAQHNTTQHKKKRSKPKKYR